MSQRDLDVDLDVDVAAILTAPTTIKTVAFGLFAFFTGLAIGLREGGRVAYQSGGPYVEGPPEYVSAIQTNSRWLFAIAGLSMLCWLVVDYRQQN